MDEGADLAACLVVVDVQYDFMQGGALAVADSTAILEPIKRLLSADQVWESVVATQDFHPKGHISFASSHPGAKVLDTRDVEHPLVSGETIKQVMWPDHCIQATHGVELNADIVENLKRLRESSSSDVVIIRKGSECNVDGYSGLSDNAYSRFSPLVRYLSSSSRVCNGVSGKSKAPIDIAVVVGLATDYCVFSTAVDLLKFGYQVVIPRDATRGVEGSRSSSALDKLGSAGAIVVQTANDALDSIKELKSRGRSTGQRQSYMQQFYEEQAGIWKETVDAAAGDG